MQSTRESLSTAPNNAGEAFIVPPNFTGYVVSEPQSTVRDKQFPLRVFYVLALLSTIGILGYMFA